MIIGHESRWELRTDDGSDTIADVTITAPRSTLARFLTTPPPREPHAQDIEITGQPAAIRTFLKALEVFPLGQVGARSSREADATL